MDLVGVDLGGMYGPSCTRFVDIKSMTLMLVSLPL